MFNQSTFTTQPFGKCLDGYVTSDHEFYLLDLSDYDHVIKKKIAHVEDVKLASDKNRIFECVSEIKLDWESHLMYQLSKSDNDEPTIRAYATTSSRTGSNCIHSNRSWFKFNNVETFEKEQVNILERINEEGIGFVGGSMILSCSGGEPVIERGNYNEFTVEKCSELPPYVRPQFPLRNTTLLITLPCEDVLNRKYSINALYYNGTFYQYDLESGKFKVENPITCSTECDKTFSFTGTGFNDNCKIIPYLEGHRLRVFVHQNRCLYELVWNQEGTQIVLVKHLDWIFEILSIVRLDNFGLLVS